MTISTTIAVDDLQSLLEKTSAEPGVPKYARLANAIREGVLLGVFEPGQRIPTETDLAKLLPVSVGTIQKALGELMTVGLIVRNRKSGSFIADRHAQVSEVFVYRFKDPVTGEPMMPFVDTRAVAHDTSDGPWRAFLEVDDCIRVDRVVGFDGQPPAFSSVYFKPEHGSVFLDKPLAELNGTSVHRMLIDQFGLPTLRMEHSLSCRLLPEAARHHLKLSADAFGMIWDIRDFTLRNRPVLFQRYHLPPGHAGVEIDETCVRESTPMSKMSDVAVSNNN